MKLSEIGDWLDKNSTAASILILTRQVDKSKLQLLIEHDSWPAKTSTTKQVLAGGHLKFNLPLDIFVKNW